MIMEKGKDFLKHTQWKHHCVTHLKDVTDFLKHTQWKHHCVTHLKDVTELRKLAVHVLLFKS